MSSTPLTSNASLRMFWQKITPVRFAVVGGLCTKRNYTRPYCGTRLLLLRAPVKAAIHKRANVLSMDNLSERAELDDRIEALARSHPSLSLEQQREDAAHIIAETESYIRALTGTVPPACAAALARATGQTLGDCEVPRILHDVQDAIEHAERMMRLVGTAPRGSTAPKAPKSLRETTDALLEKLKAKQPDSA